MNLPEWLVTVTEHTEFCLGPSVHTDSQITAGFDSFDFDSQ